jgi:hypothetical protein
MNESLQRELEDLCLKILRRDYSDAQGLLEATRELYEKAILLKHAVPGKANVDAPTKNDVQDVPAMPQKPVEKPLPEAKKEEPRNEPKVEPKPEPKAEPIQEVVKPVEQPKPVEQLKLEEEPKVVEQPKAAEKPKEVKSPKAAKSPGAGQLLQQLQNKELKVGLNDRIAFVKKLFHGKTDDFNRVLSQINSFSNYEEADSFLKNLVVPEYGWDLEEEFAVRFVNLVRLRFGLDEIPEE